MTAPLGWVYVNCSQTPGGPAAAGLCALPGTSGLSPGTYQFRLFRNDGFNKLATSNNFTVNAPVGSATVTVTPPLLPAGGSVTVGWSVSADPRAGIGSVSTVSGAPNGSFVDLEIRQLHQTPGGPVASGSCNLPLASTLAAGQLRDSIVP